MEVPRPAFLGYTLKLVVARPDWLAPAQVDEICSVSNCISKAPEPPERWTRWAFNDSTYYDTPELAERDGAEGVTYSMFALELYPLLFDGDRAIETPVVELLNSRSGVLPAGPREGFVWIGYDVVGIRTAQAAAADQAAQLVGFDCSPLSCNSGATEIPVNRYCLLDTWDAAVAVAVRCARGEFEPGPYVIMGVYRRG
jgi:hypothetical protein